MPLYIADYLTDTRHLSARQHGGYLLLIMAAWQADGKLPASNASALARLAGMSEAEWSEDGPVIASFFDADWRHARVDAELAKAKEKYRKRSEAGRRGGKAKAGPQAAPKQSNSIATSNVEASESSNAEASSSHTQTTPNGVVAPPEDVSRETGKVPTRLPEDYEPDIDVALAYGIPLAAALGEAKKFKNHFAAVPDDAGLKLDWDATWDNWCIRAAEFRLKDGKALAKTGTPKPMRWILADAPEWADAVAGWKATHEGKPPPKIAGLGGLGWNFPVPPSEAVAA